MNFLVFDFETTGLSHELHAPVQIAAIPVINGIKGEPFVSYIKPFKDAVIDIKALEVNKLTFDQLQTFPDSEEVLKSFLAWIDSHQTMFALMGHNIQFDRKFLYRWMCRHMCHGPYTNSFRVHDYCTLEMARSIFKGKRIKPDKMNLASLCKFFKIELTNAHDALADIEATYEVYLALRSSLPVTVETKKQLTYQEKKVKYINNPAYIVFNADGSFYGHSRVLHEEEAGKFIGEEIYHLSERRS